MNEMGKQRSDQH